jgi:hypothetical protein
MSSANAKHPFWHTIELKKCKTPILVTVELSKYKYKTKIQYLIGMHLIDSKYKSTRHSLKLQKKRYS